MNSSMRKNPGHYSWPRFLADLLWLAILLSLLVKVVKALAEQSM